MVSATLACLQIALFVGILRASTLNPIIDLMTTLYTGYTTKTATGPRHSLGKGLFPTPILVHLTIMAGDGGGGGREIDGFFWEGEGGTKSMSIYIFPLQNVLPTKK